VAVAAAMDSPFDGQPGEESNAAGAGREAVDEAVDDGPGLAHYTANGSLHARYVDGCKAAGLKVSNLVENSILECTEAAAESLHIEAPGNHPLVFRSRLGDEDMKLFSAVFADVVPYLSRLDLAYNLLSDAGAAHLAQGLLGQQARRLTGLTIRGNSIGPNGCDMLIQSLRLCPSLRRLDVGLNPLGRAGGLMLVQLVQDCPDLQEVYLADTEIDIDVIVAISAVLLTGLPRLKVCDLENPRISTLQEEHTVHLGRMLRVNVFLSEIYLGKHRMRDEGVRQLVSFLLENKTLRLLDLRCNEIGADGACHLGKLLGADCQLRRLNLEGNRIGEKDNVNGAQALADALLNNRMLNSLNLNNNGLCGDALQVLGTAIDQNSTLETVELFHSNWDQPSSFKFHQIFNDRQRINALRADFVTSAVDFRIDICQVQDFNAAG